MHFQMLTRDNFKESIKEKKNYSGDIFMIRYYMSTAQEFIGVKLWACPEWS